MNDGLQETALNVEKQMQSGSPPCVVCFREKKSVGKGLLFTGPEFRYCNASACAVPSGRRTTSQRVPYVERDSASVFPETGCWEDFKCMDGDGLCRSGHSQHVTFAGWFANVFVASQRR